MSKKENQSDIVLKHTLPFGNKLVGKKVTRVRRLTKGEMELMDWYNNPLVIEFGELAMILQQDDEGNDGGAAMLYNYNTQESDIVYTIRKY